MLLFRCSPDLSIPSSPVCAQMLAGSQLIQEINQRDSADAIFYTNINARNDVFTKADSNGKMRNCDRTNAAGEILQCNVTVQDFCPANLVEHVGAGVERRRLQRHPSGPGAQEDRSQLLGALTGAP